MIKQLRIFAMIQRLDEIQQEKVNVLCFDFMGFEKSLNKLSEVTKKISEEMIKVNHSFDELKYMEGKKINRASRRGHKESKRKKNFNHYN